MSNSALLQTSLDFPVRCGKVRDVYDFGDEVLLVSTDRISAFDWILPSGIPDKGRVLTQIAAFWFEQLGEENHLITVDVDQMECLSGVSPEVKAELAGRSTLCKKSQVFPIECIVRGCLTGSGWKEYQKSQTICGIHLPGGLQESVRLETPIFTPTTKAEEGHDENVTFEEMCDIIGAEAAAELRDRSISLFQRGADYAAERGIIIADTKFEWGLCDGKIILIDEVLTPDSSRFWPADDYEVGRSQKSFDKQFVRDWLLASDWDRQSVPPQLPEEIISKTRSKYIEAYERLTGNEFPWK
ncbi:MAG: phosphoribosylaminoimidazolesuccinocarboxamide synthase [Planctomycetaceae bacterium]|nr:phosphoribosylaminoimidazolesuccinocarboxamide synthase [Planctomycetaceae bacterium]